MEPILAYRGRLVYKEDISFIEDLIASHPDDHRTALSRKICEAWRWVQPNGHLKDMICRGLLLRLEREGHIRLPQKRTSQGGWQLKRRDPERIQHDQSPIQTHLGGLLPITFRQVRHTSSEKLYNSLIAQFHYLGYIQPVGAHLKYVVFAGERPIACFAWSSAPWHIGCRDRYIGWDSHARKKNLHFLAYNTRFLLVPWVHVPHLASHLLGKCLRRLSRDWQALYAHPLYWAETFIDTDRFKGACYQAANWIYLGTTTGRGKNEKNHRPNRSIKAVWGYPLTRNFKERLYHVG